MLVFSPFANSKHFIFMNNITNAGNKWSEEKRRFSSARTVLNVFFGEQTLPFANGDLR